MICAQCLKPLPQGRKDRLHCSARCRRDSYADRNSYECIDCGKPCRDHNAAKERPRERCQQCSWKRILDLRRLRSVAYYDSLARLWAAGHSIGDIASILDSTPNAISTKISQLRAGGDDRFPYRNRGYGRVAA